MCYKGLLEIGKVLSKAHVPFPLSATLNTPPPPLILSVVLLNAFLDGVKVTFTVQLPLAGMPVPQVFVSAKSAELAPLMSTPPHVIWFADTFCSVTVCGTLVLPTGTLPKAILVGDTLRKLALPESGTVCVPAPSTNVTAPLCGPFVVGRNATRIVQDAPAARDDLQLFPSKNSPETVMLEMLSGKLPAFVRLAY